MRETLCSWSLAIHGNGQGNLHQCMSLYLRPPSAPRSEASLLPFLNVPSGLRWSTLAVTSYIV